MQQITEDNFIRTLKYNGFRKGIRTPINNGTNNYVLNNGTHFIEMSFSFDKKKDCELKCTYGERKEIRGMSLKNRVDFSCSNLEEFLCYFSRFYALELLPEFDFEKYLIENGFDKKFAGDPQETNDFFYPFEGDRRFFDGVMYVADEEEFYFHGTPVKTTKENADILIQIAKLAGELK